MNSKSIFLSKTMAVNFIVTSATLIGYFYPATSQWVKDHAVTILSVLGYANLGLRMITHGRVSLFGSDS